MSNENPHYPSSLCNCDECTGGGDLTPLKVDMSGTVVGLTHAESFGYANAKAVAAIMTTIHTEAQTRFEDPKYMAEFWGLVQRLAEVKKSQAEAYGKEGGV